MKKPGILVALVFLLWLFKVTPAFAQNPYHCDSLKLTFFDKDKIFIRYFQTEKSCSATCSFCKTIEKQDWIEVQSQLRRISKTFYESPEPLTSLRTLLLTHRMVNFVLPPEPDAQSKKIS